jgi:ubiquinone/menaquinone biosynthesis C-methylase UbiE
MESPQSPPLPSPFDDGELYDVILGKFDYDLGFYLRLAKEAKGPVLDVACGTGRIMLPCLQAGVDIEGVDLHDGMLNRLRTRAADLGLEPRLHRADMSDFRLARLFALVMIPFNSFVHNLTADAQIQCLKSCREHLQPGGLLAFDTYFPDPATIVAPDGTRVLELETTHPVTGVPVRLYDTRSFNRVAQIQRSYNEVEFLDTAGRATATHASVTSVRWIYKSEMELLLRLSGFGRWQICGGFDRRPLEQETDAMIVLAWNEGPRLV